MRYIKNLSFNCPLTAPFVIDNRQYPYYYQPIMFSLFSWIKQHKLTVFLLIVIIFLAVKPAIPRPLTTLRQASYGVVSDMTAPVGIGGFTGMTKSVESVPVPNEAPPQTDVSSRLVIQNSYLSLLVKNVMDVKDKIISYAQSAGGYMVNSSVSNPQDAPTATVTIRVEADKLKETLTYLHSLSVKVVSENLEGYDVTDQYVDVDKRIALLEKTIVKFQSILDQAQEISDITNLNQQIINLQSQIDNYKGEQEALKQNAKLAKLTVYLSTDEMALPYAPSETWRPDVIFKLAVRSIVGNLRAIGTMIIWIVVYGVFWIPVLLIIWLVWKRFNRSK